MWQIGIIRYVRETKKLKGKTSTIPKASIVVTVCRKLVKVREELFEEIIEKKGDDDA